MEVRPSFYAPLAFCLALLGTAGDAAAQQLVSVKVSNRSHESTYVIAYDPYCRIRVFEGVIVHGGSTTVSVCLDGRNGGTLDVYDRFGRSLRFKRLRQGSSVAVRFR